MITIDLFLLAGILSVAVYMLTENVYASYTSLGLFPYITVLLTRSGKPEPGRWQSSRKSRRRRRERAKKLTPDFEDQGLRSGGLVLHGSGIDRKRPIGAARIDT